MLTAEAVDALIMSTDFLLMLFFQYVLPSILDSLTKELIVSTLLHDTFAVIIFLQHQEGSSRASLKKNAQK